MRSTVYDISSHLASGMTREETPEDFPHLTREEVLARLERAPDRAWRRLAAPA